MPRSPVRAATWTTALLLTGLVLGLVFRYHHRLFAPKPIAQPAAPMASGGRTEPPLMLWAWETPEDLTALDPAKAGVAFLSREILLSSTDSAGIQIRPRLQPLHTPPGAFLMAVVRIEVSPNFAAGQASPQFIADTAQTIVAAARAPSVRALQVDFDATASQRVFYAKLLKQVRADLRPELPLSITALVSWCSEPSWIPQLPEHTVDEAVPMFFRMGGPASARATAPKFSTVTVPLCAGSVGLATDETWPEIAPQQRVYLFRPGPWSASGIAKLNIKGYQGLR
jgi:hypothetical protein